MIFKVWCFWCNWHAFAGVWGNFDILTSLKIYRKSFYCHRNISTKVLKCYKYIYNSDTKSVFFLLIANWSLPHSPVYLPIYLNIQVEKKEYLHKEIEDKDGQPKVFLLPYAPEIAAKCIFDTIDNDLYSKSGSEGSPNLISTKVPLPHEVLYSMLYTFVFYWESFWFNWGKN